jgi:hypothetical protein
MGPPGGVSEPNRLMTALLKRAFPRERLAGDEPGAVPVPPPADVGQRGRGAAVG